MKVLEYPPMDWEAEHVCSRCEARLLIEIEDIKCYSNNTLSPKNFYVNCAVCGACEYPTQALPWFVERFARGAFVSWPPDHRLSKKTKRG